MGSDNRQRTRLIGVRVSESEKQAIAQNAADCGLNPGTFLRHLGLGHQVKGVVDQKAVLDLLQVNADLGRLGGLLKLWLTDDEHRPALAQQREIVALIREIADTQGRLRTRVLSL